MKKVLSVLIAVLVMSVAFAQNPANVRTRTNALQFATQNANPYVKHTGMTRTVTSVTLANAAKDAIDTIEVNVPNPTLSDHIEDAGWIQIYGNTADNVYKASFSNIDVRTTMWGSYDYDAFDLNWSWVIDLAAADTIFVANGNATMTQTTDGWSFEAYYLGEDNHCYHFTAAYTIPTMEDALDTTEVVVVNPTFGDYRTTDGDVYFAGATADSSYIAEVDYYATNIAGTYTYEDFYAYYTAVYYRDPDDSYASVGDIVAGNLTVTDLTDSYTVDAYLLAEDMHAYHVTMTYVIPVATDTIDVLVPTAMLQSESGWFSTTHTWTGASSDATYNVTIAYSGNDVDGDFAFVQLSSSSQINTISFIDGHFSVLVTDGGYDLVAYLIGSDMHCYHITMNYTVPTMDDATDTITYDIPAATLTDLTASSTGAFQLRGYTADEAMYASVTAYSTQIPGNYEFEDFYTDYTYVYDVLLENQIAVVAGHAAVTATSTGYSMDAYLLGVDFHCYHITFTYSTPVASDTIEVVCDGNATFRDYQSLDGSYMFAGFTADSVYGAAINYFSTTIAGSFAWADMDQSYTKVYFNLQGLETYDANATVTATANGYNVEAYILCTDNHCYHVTMTYTESGINTVSNDAVRVYPNPATDVLHIEANGITHIEVIDLAGRIVRTQVENTVNVSGLANGIYMLRTTTTEGVNVQKIVKK